MPDVWRHAVTVRDEPPDNTPPPCPRCCLSSRVLPATDQEQRWGHNWYCEADSTYFVGSAVEFQNAQAKKAALAAERGELDRAGEVGRNQGVLGGDL